MISDAYLFQLNDTTDRIDHFGISLNRREYNIPYLYTKNGLRLAMPEKDYGYTADCKLIVRRGLVFRVPETVAIEFEGKYTSYGVSVMNRTEGGTVIVVMDCILMLTFLYYLLYKKTVNWRVYLAFIFIFIFILFELILTN